MYHFSISNLVPRPIIYACPLTSVASIMHQHCMWGELGDEAKRALHCLLDHVGRRETEERWDHREPREYLDPRDPLSLLAQWEKKVIVEIQ